MKAVQEKPVMTIEMFNVVGEFVRETQNEEYSFELEDMKVSGKADIWCRFNENGESFVEATFFPQDKNLKVLDFDDYKKFYGDNAVADTFECPRKSFDAKVTTYLQDFDEFLKEYYEEEKDNSFEDQESLNREYSNSRGL